ncbi:hypothetical protein [Ruficoccus sp. ZRK36]|uniref:rolling circle replication-associated protein n=1 Tax=Ruficoccus sp. ZRK36 TaxID=2866311 RepID=UPI001C73691C|nr:hypothetical protein [Ruficoccus sp. ZRK36]QYY34909.1 hypothetical protein K0V07_11410 [Ruficoccus sp. ZRK36]
MSELENFYGVQVRGYHGPNWITERGVYLKRKEIERKGLPVLKRCKFLTLTTDGHGLMPPQEVYELGSARMRRFLAKVRKVIGKFGWAWKLEFHEDGYPHWHLIIDYRKKIPPDFLDMFTKWWGLGRVNVQGIREKRFRYLFKYVSKMASGDCDEETGLDLPGWVLDYRKRRKDGRLTAGIRFWQTGGGFYTKPAKADDEEGDEPKGKKPQQTSRVPYTLRQRWGMWMRKGTVYVKGWGGKYLRSQQVYFQRPYHEVAQTVINAFVGGKAAPVSNALGFMCGLELINKEIQLWKRKQINRLATYYSRTGTVFFSVD